MSDRGATLSPGRRTRAWTNHGEGEHRLNAINVVDFDPLHNVFLGVRKRKSLVAFRYRAVPRGTRVSDPGFGE